MHSTIQIYGPAFSSFLRSVRLMCACKSLRHELTDAPFGTPTLWFTKAHEALHPFSKLPVLIHGDFVLPETLAIGHYLDTLAEPLLYSGTAAEQARHLSLASMIALYVHKAVMLNTVLEFAFPKGEGGSIRQEQVLASAEQLRYCLSWVETQIEDKHVGPSTDLSIGDALLLPMLDYLDQLPQPFNVLPDFPALTDYLTHHRQQPYTDGILGAPEIGRP